MATFGATSSSSNYLPGHVIPIVGANNSAFTSLQAIYFGGLAGLVNQTSGGIQRIYSPRGGTITRVLLYGHFGTAGTNESWTMHVRVSDTTNASIAAVALASACRVWSNSAMSVTIAASDYLEIHASNPNWATCPLNGRFGGYIYIE
jgi:hypothetical protein